VIGRVDGNYGAAEIRKATPERKARIAQELLADPEVAREVVTPEVVEVAIRRDPRVADRALRAVAQTPEGKETTRSIKAHQARKEEVGPSKIGPLGVLPLFLEHAAYLRDVAEQTTVDGATSDAQPMLRLLGEHLIATGQLFVEAAKGNSTKFSEEELYAMLDEEKGR
jgi:hypothetical protein